MHKPAIIGESVLGPGQAQAEQPVARTPAEPEVGGRNGPEPTRYGDWEKDGRCIDF